MKVAEGIIPPHLSDRCIEHYLSVSAAEHSEVYQFLTFEALLLDHCNYRQWIRMMSGALHYRISPYDFGDRTVEPETPRQEALVEYDYDSICRRVRELTDGARREPGSHARFRRLITNMSVSSVVHGKFEVVSYLLFSSASTEIPRETLYTIERRDRLCRAGRTFRVENREMWVDWNARELTRLQIIV